MAKQADVIGAAIAHINDHIQDIEGSLQDEQTAIRKAQYRAEILDHMRIKARLTRQKMIEELNKIMN